MKPKFWLLRGLKFLVFAALFLVAIGYGTMYLWNWLMPDLFHLPKIDLAHTYGLLLLSRILFGFKGGGHRGGWAARRQAWQRRVAAKMESLSPEDREKLRAKMARHCGGGPAWMRNRSASAEQAPTVG